MACRTTLTENAMRRQFEMLASTIGKLNVSHPSEAGAR
jgi:hypothetical protein